VKILIVHGSYGCDTGCCGHWVEVKDGPEPERIDGGWSDFEFGHPYSKPPAEFREWAEDVLRKRYGEHHVQDLDWENCLVSDDW